MNEGEQLQLFPPALFDPGSPLSRLNDAGVHDACLRRVAYGEEALRAVAKYVRDAPWREARMGPLGPIWCAGRSVEDAVQEGDLHRYKYRFLRSSWGLAIDLTGALCVDVLIPDDAEPVGERTWVRLPHAGLSPRDRWYLSDGVRRCAPFLEEATPDVTVLIDVRSAVFALTDYQEDAMAPAMIAWLGPVFQIDQPLVSIDFDRAANRYVIHYE